MNLSAIVKPCQEKIYQKGDIYCCYDEESIDKFDQNMLSSAYWQQKKSIIGSAQGRGTTYFLKYLKNEWVLRHYYRGGLIGKLINDSYLFTGFDKTRAAKEYNLLKTLVALKLPAPKPIAYRIKKSGLTYQADILSTRVTNAQDLVAMLSTQSVSEALWRKIGACINTFHQQGIYHHDLNAHNILIDDKEKVWLIDFDQGEQRAPQQAWQQNNLNRLLRSFNKEKSKLLVFHWQADNWQYLIEGYLAAKN